jgi:phage shock protein PspC (stress-responsive transcriptional regulator)
MNHRHLYRSRDDRMLAGVAGGLAELWDADPSFVRIVWALLVVLTGGIALVVYIVMAIVVPEEGDIPAVGPAATDASTAGTNPAQSPGTPPAGAPNSDWRQTRNEARMRAREARAAWRSSHPRDRSAAVVIGVLLVLIGTWFLVREYLPTIDWDWFWPIVLIVLGVLVLVVAVRPRQDGPGGGGGS